jgi:FADH2 O2-dependent halogenase
MLPSAVGFIDPLLSTGFPLTLLGVSRLVAILSNGLAAPNFQSELELYASKTTEELLATSRLIASLYGNMSNFPVFQSIALLYFAAASYSEAGRRLGKPHLATSFLLHDHPAFGPICKQLLERAMHIASDREASSLIQDIRHAIEPIDVAGFSDSSKHGWYPVNAEDLLQSADKVEATRGEIESMLLACGFYHVEVG